MDPEQDQASVHVGRLSTFSPVDQVENGLRPPPTLNPSQTEVDGLRKQLMRVMKDAATGGGQSGSGGVPG